MRLKEVTALWRLGVFGVDFASIVSYVRIVHVWMSQMHVDVRAHGTRRPRPLGRYSTKAWPGMLLVLNAKGSTYQSFWESLYEFLTLTNLSGSN